MVDWTRVKGIVKQGHGVASGLAHDPRFPEGTLKLQQPFFQERGLDLDGYYLGTINLSIAPCRYRVIRPKYTFAKVQWTSVSPAEDFSFFDCQILLDSGADQSGLIYYPHPETKPEHFQAPDILEIITFPIQGLQYGDVLRIKIVKRQIELETPN